MESDAPKVHHKFTTSFPESGPSPCTKFHDFRAEEPSLLNVEAQQGPHAMESLLSGSSRIEIEPAPAGILLDH